MSAPLKISLILVSSLLFAYDLHADKSHRENVQWVPVEQGMASWYGKDEQGKLTASGEIFDPTQFTAASRHLPFNTIVRVTNRENGCSVKVRINDRGPYLKGRVLDVSEAAADCLKMKSSGVVPVEIDVVQPAIALSENSVLP